MSAPVAALPAAENDSRPARPVVYQDRSSALAAAQRSARLASPSGIYRLLTGVVDCFEPVEGGVAYRVYAAPIDWEVAKVTGAELARLLQAGIRHAVSTCADRAAAHDLAANASKPGSAVYRLHARYAAEQRELGRALELKLTVGAVRSATTVESWDAFEASNRALPAHLQVD